MLPQQNHWFCRFGGFRNRQFYSFSSDFRNVCDHSGVFTEICSQVAPGIHLYNPKRHPAIPTAPQAGPAAPQAGQHQQLQLAELLRSCRTIVQISLRASLGLHHDWTPDSLIIWTLEISQFFANPVLMYKRCLQQKCSPISRNTTSPPSSIFRTWTEKRFFHRLKNDFSSSKFPEQPCKFLSKNFVITKQFLTQSRHSPSPIGVLEPQLVILLVMDLGPSDREFLYSLLANRLQN